MRIHDLRQHLTDLGAKPAHAQRLLRQWVMAQPLAADRKSVV